MLRSPPRTPLSSSSAASDVYKRQRVDAATARYHELGDSIKASEKRLAEIAVLKAHITNYAKTRPVYDAYRKTGYSKHFLETHRAEITLHKACLLYTSDAADEEDSVALGGRRLIKKKKKKKTVIYTQ